MCVSPQLGEVPCYLLLQLTLSPQAVRKKKQKSTYHSRAILYTITHSDHDRSRPSTVQTSEYAHDASYQPSPKRHDQGSSEFCTEMGTGIVLQDYRNTKPLAKYFPRTPLH